MTSLAEQVADFVEQHLDVALDPWQRAVIDVLYATVSPSSTD